MAFANFHMHTYFSDGVISPGELVRDVYAVKDLDYFALTDHDSLSGIEPVFRLQNEMAAMNAAGLIKTFVPGIELSLRDEQTDLTIHLIGLFTFINHHNYREMLQRIDTVLGDFCRGRSLQRGIKDMEARVRKAFTMNLDGLKERFDSEETIIDILKDKVEAINRSRFSAFEKEGDIIKHPIPITYQIIIDSWEELVPSSSREKITLYILRADQQRMESLAGIYLSEGMRESEAKEMALMNQGVLAKFDGAIIKDKGILEGLDLLQKAGAVSILAHPAMDHYQIGYAEYDHHILYPLIAHGLNGIEVFYPYDKRFRDDAISHYHTLSRELGLLISGGTDFHGDGRTGLTDVELPCEEATRIISYKGEN